MQWCFKKITYSFFLFILFCFFNSSYATVGVFKFEFSNRDSIETKQFLDSINFIKALNKSMLNLHKSGYVTNTIDTIYWKNDSAFVTIFLSKQYQKIIVSNVVSKNNTEKLSFYPKNNSSFGVEEFFKLEDKIVSYWENNGFPFCSVQLINTSSQENNLYGDLEIVKNLPVKIDSINISGSLKLNKYFVYNYTGIKPGSVYQENKVQYAGKRLKELAFMSVEKPPQLVFTRKYTKLSYFLNNKKANQFDGILGFLPDNVTGKILFTGQAHIRLLNSFSAGEFLEADWRKLQVNTQDLKINFNYPYIFRTPIGLDYSFNLYKRDTTFTDLKNVFGIQYLLSGANYFKFFYSVRSSSLISTQGLQNITFLPEYADVSTNAYGIGLKFDFTNYRFNPRKGIRTNFNFSVGNKQIRKNPNVNPEVYKTIPLKSVQYNSDGFIDFFIPIFSKSALLFGAKGALISGSNIFTNELFRIGGLQSLRGFDDESIFTSFYVINNLEYRFLFDKNSNFFLFASRAYIENTSINKRIFDRPISFGTGISFETKAGIFNLTYALGKQLNNPLILRAAKVHFGIISLF